MEGDGGSGGGDGGDVIIGTGACFERGGGDYDVDGEARVVCDYQFS